MRGLAVLKGTEPWTSVHGSTYSNISTMMGPNKVVHLPEPCFTGVTRLCRNHTLKHQVTKTNSCRTIAGIERHTARIKINLGASHPCFKSGRVYMDPHLRSKEVTPLLWKRGLPPARCRCYAPWEQLEANKQLQRRSFGGNVYPTGSEIPTSSWRLIYESTKCNIFRCAARLANLRRRLNQTFLCCPSLGGGTVYPPDVIVSRQ